MVSAEQWEQWITDIESAVGDAQPSTEQPDVFSQRRRAFAEDVVKRLVPDFIQAIHEHHLYQDAERIASAAKTARAALHAFRAVLQASPPRRPKEKTAPYRVVSSNPEVLPFVADRMNELSGWAVARGRHYHVEVDNLTRGQIYRAIEKEPGIGVEELLKVAGYAWRGEEQQTAEAAAKAREEHEAWAVAVVAEIDHLLGEGAIEDRGRGGTHAYYAVGQAAAPPSSSSEPRWTFAAAAQDLDTYLQAMVALGTGSGPQQLLHDVQPVDAPAPPAKKRGRPENRLAIALARRIAERYKQWFQAAAEWVWLKKEKKWVKAWVLVTKERREKTAEGKWKIVTPEQRAIVAKQWSFLGPPTHRKQGGKYSEGNRQRSPYDRVCDAVEKILENRGFTPPISDVARATVLQRIKARRPRQQRRGV